MNPDNIDSFENEEDEAEILTNQDETDPGDVNLDDKFMGAVPQEVGEDSSFERGERDVKAQMDRNVSARDKFSE